MNNFDNVTPKKIGNFNVPKNVIECKIDTLAFLELLLRKNICTWEEVEEVREAVVMHLNVIFPELQLSYTTPQPLREQAPITPPEQPQKPLYYTANPTDIENVSAAPSQSQDQQQGQETAPSQPQAQPIQHSQNRPLFHTAAPKVMGGSAKPGMTPIRPINQKPAPVQNQQPQQNPNPEANPQQAPADENQPQDQQQGTMNEVDQSQETNAQAQAQPVDNSAQQTQPPAANVPAQPVTHPDPQSSQTQAAPNQQSQQAAVPNNINTSQAANPAQQTKPMPNQAQAGQPQSQAKPYPTQKPPFPTSGPPKILNNPPRKKF